jgi:hypothetical protein
MNGTRLFRGGPREFPSQPIVRHRPSLCAWSCAGCCRLLVAAIVNILETEEELIRMKRDQTASAGASATGTPPPSSGQTGAAEEVGRGDTSEVWERVSLAREPYERMAESGRRPQQSPSSRAGETVSRRAHNPETPGSTPGRATSGDVNSGEASVGRSRANQDTAGTTQASSAAPAASPDSPVASATGGALGADSSATSGQGSGAGLSGEGRPLSLSRRALGQALLEWGRKL